MILFFFHSHCIRFTFVSPRQRLKVKGVTAKKKITEGVSLDSDLPFRE